MAPIYAVVDLETTGTDPKKDAIIQVGCVLVQNGEIISRFKTDVNPAQKIPKNIEILTGITNSQVKKAPLFSDIAETFFGYLKGTIFVAHNITFDYRFLKAAFKKEGISNFSLPGIDTVTLAQIFFPTELSFRLKDLAQRFNFLHDRPHQADSDAEVTAELFLKIQEKIQSLPEITLEAIVKRALGLPFQTGDFLVTELAKKQQQITPVYPNLVYLEGLALVKKEEMTPAVLTPKSYPAKKKEKLPLFPEEFGFRKAQARMMNLVYDFFAHSEEKFYVLEAPSGIGKTFGYLFPLRFLLWQKSPVIIATSTLLLQQQLLTDLEKIQEKSDVKLQGLILKSPSHYLDLERFAKSLNYPVTKQVAFFQMMLLVWLTETKTGDFSELNLLKIQDPYFLEIASGGNLKKGPFAKMDFYNRLVEKAGTSQVLITNHAYLLQKKWRQTLRLKKTPYLIVDEAHQFPENLIESEKVSFSFQDFLTQITNLRGFLGEEEVLFLPDRKKNLLKEILGSLEENFYTLQRYLLGRFPLEYPLIIEDKLQKSLLEELGPLPSALFEIIQDLKRFLEETLLTFEKTPNQDWLFFQNLKTLQGTSTVFLNLFQRNTGELTWLEKIGGTLIFYEGSLQATYLEKANWAQAYEKILLTGATLKIGSKNLLQNRLHLKGALTSQLQSPYDYEKQLRFFMPEELTADNAFALLVTTLKEYAEKIHQPLLVLFSTQKSLTACYHALQPTCEAQFRELLAQGVNGTKEKLLKRFYLSEEAILLGNETFWEGLDLPGKKLPAIFILKLPFENPNRPLVAQFYQSLEKEGKNAFYEAALPTCSAHLTQAFGRLLRSETDRGVLVLFDERLLTKSYGKILQKHLPKKLQVETLPKEELLPAMEEFLQQEITEKEDLS